MYMCQGTSVIYGSDGGLKPTRCQVITLTSADLLSLRSIGTNFCEFQMENTNNVFPENALGMSSAKWRSFYSGLNLLTRFLQIVEEISRERHRDDVTTSQRFWVTDPRWEESTVSQRIPLTNGQWCANFRCSLMLSWTNWCCCFETYWSPYDVT